MMDYGDTPGSSAGLRKIKHPKMFLNIMRQGLSKEMQETVSTHYNIGL